MWVCRWRNHRRERSKPSYQKITRSQGQLPTDSPFLECHFFTWCVVTSMLLFNTQGAGSIPCIRCLSQTGKAVFKFVALSQHTMSAQGQTASVPINSVYFLLQWRVQDRSVELVHHDEYLLTQTVMLTDMRTGKQRFLFHRPQFFDSMILTG